jgi:hypothetical protein
MKIEDGHVLTTDQAVAAQCNVCGEPLDLQPEQDDKHTFATTLAAEHCGKIYSFGIQIVKASVANKPDEMKSKKELKAEGKAKDQKEEVKESKKEDKKAEDFKEAKSDSKVDIKYGAPKSSAKEK